MIAPILPIVAHINRTNIYNLIVLHYIPNLTKSMGQAKQSVQTIHAALSERVESHLYTGNASTADFLRSLKKIQPEVLHIHGCWNIQLAVALNIARHLGIPVITSPHNALSPDILQQEFWKKRLPRILLYQFLTIRHSFVIHASSQQEHDDLKALGWKKRIAMIPLEAGTSEAATMADSFIALYQKVIDTTWYNRLKPNEEACFRQLLAADIAYNYEAPVLPEEMSKTLSELTPANWKAIQVYALDHGVHTHILSATQNLGITLPRIITQLPVRYPSKVQWHKGQPQSVSDDILACYKANSLELDLATKVHDLYNTLACQLPTDNCPHSMLHLIEIFEVIRWKYYDEALFVEIITAMGINKFCSQLLGAIAHIFDLPIGYMPIDPTDDSTTQLIIRNLNNLP